MLVSAVSMNGVIPSIKNSRQSNTNSVSNSSNDSFQKSQVSFSSKKFPSGIFRDEEIEIAQRFVTRIGNDWKEELHNWYISKNKCRCGVGMYESDPGWDSRIIRGLLAVFSLGTSEVLNAVTKGIDKLTTNRNTAKEAKIFVDRISELVDDMRKGHKGKEWPW